MYHISRGQCSSFHTNVHVYAIYILGKRPWVLTWDTTVKKMSDVCVIMFYCPVQRYSDWQQKFGQYLGKKVVLLTGETSVDLRLLRDVS